MQDLCLNYLPLTNESVWDWFTFHYRSNKDGVVDACHDYMAPESRRSTSTSSPPPPFYRISHELVTKLFFCLRWQSLLRHVHVSVCVCLCGGLCFPGRAFDSLCCEVLLRSRRCVGEDWMNESLSQVVRWWRRWSSVSGNQPDGGRHRSRWPLIHFSHSLPLPVGVGSSHTDTAGENKPLV